MINPSDMIPAGMPINMFLVVSNREPYCNLAEQRAERISFTSDFSVIRV